MESWGGRALCIRYAEYVKAVHKNTHFLADPLGNYRGALRVGVGTTDWELLSSIFMHYIGYIYIMFNEKSKYRIVYI